MATTDTFSTGQSLLAVYGALDQAVTQTSDPEIQAIVERYLPGTTGENAGWYGELLGFLGNLGPDTLAPSPIPDLGQALTVLQGPKEPRADANAGVQDAPKPKVEPGGDTAVQYAPKPEVEPGGDSAVQYVPVPEAAAETLTTTGLSRMVYAIGALSHLPSRYRPGQYDAPFAQALDRAGDGGSDLLEMLRRDFNSPDDWPHVMQVGEQRGLIGGDVAAVPLCQRKLKLVRGHVCVVLTTDFPNSDVSLDKLKAVIDPLNWDKCLPFFCYMKEEPIREDGWSRVLEHASPNCSGPRLVTPLKYWKGEGSGGPLQLPSAFVNFELDDNPAPGENGDGWVVVDEGFIRMTSTAGDPAKDGVRVRTRKVAGFRNLGFAAAAMFACTMGYGNQGWDMLFGGVKKRRADRGKGWKNWKPSTLPAADGGGEGAPKPEQPKQPAGAPDTAKRAVALAVDMLNKCIDDTSTKSTALAAKWATGAAPVAETMKFSADLAARLASDPWRYLERLSDPAKDPAQKDDK